MDSIPPSTFYSRPSATRQPAKQFFEKVFSSDANPIPRVINVDKNPAYPAAVNALKAEGMLPHRVRLRQCKYLNNVIEQDHRLVKKRTESIDVSLYCCASLPTTTGYVMCF